MSCSTQTAPAGLTLRFDLAGSIEVEGRRSFNDVQASQARKMTNASSGSDRWAGTLTKRFLRAELKAGRTPKETATVVGCSENTVRDHLALHGLLDLSGVPKTVARD